jgi:hypothetical protein
MDKQEWEAAYRRIKAEKGEKIEMYARKYILAYINGESYALPQRALGRPTNPMFSVLEKALQIEVANKLEMIKASLFDVLFYLNSVNLENKSVLNLKMSDKVREALKKLHTELTEEDFL